MKPAHAPRPRKGSLPVLPWSTCAGCGKPTGQPDPRYGLCPGCYHDRLVQELRPRS